jgi:hypothetical protein
LRIDRVGGLPPRGDLISTGDVFRTPTSFASRFLHRRSTSSQQVCGQQELRLEVERAEHWMAEVETHVDLIERLNCFGRREIPAAVGSRRSVLPESRGSDPVAAQMEVESDHTEF